LDGLDDLLDHIRCDVLQIKPFPTVEHAYAHIRREALCQAVMTTGVDDLPGAGLASKSLKHSSHSLSFHGGKSGYNSKSRSTSDGIKCSHCGGGQSILMRPVSSFMGILISGMNSRLGSAVMEMVVT